MAKSIEQILTDDPNHYWHSVNCQWSGFVPKKDASGILDGPWVKSKGMDIPE